MSISVSIREQVLQSISVALGAAGTPATGGVTRSKLDQLSSASLPCYDFTPGDEKIEDPGEFGDRGSVTRTLPVCVRAIVNAAVQEGQGEPGATVVPIDDSALDSFYVFAVQQLAGGTANFDGLVEDVVEQSSVPVFQPGGLDLIGLEINFEIKFATKRGDPTQRG